VEFKVANVQLERVGRLAASKLANTKENFYTQMYDERVFTLPQRPPAVKSHVESCRLAMFAEFDRALGPFKTYPSVVKVKDQLTQHALLELDNMLEENKMEWHKLIDDP
jgi:hypothetical protein